MNPPTNMQIYLADEAARRAPAAEAWHALRKAARLFAARWRRQRQAAAMRATLYSLDAHMLRDLGFHRSEIDSVIAEINGDAPCTRVQSERAVPHPYY